MPLVVRRDKGITCPKCQARNFPQSGTLRDGVYYTKCVSCAHEFKFRAVSEPKSNVTFTINGQPQTVTNEIPATMTLNEYLRDVVRLTGTKVMCFGGNCGSCNVTVRFNNPATGRQQSKVINSCLCPVYSCEGWEITTTEGIGNVRDGLHETQQKIADYNGSQCGFCTPGMVMSMYSHLQENPSPSKADVQKALDGNICRCTGFRSILDAYNTFAPDKSKTSCKNLDIEDMGCMRPCQKSPLMIVSQGSRWYKPTDLQSVLDLVRETLGQKVKLVVGNSSVAFTKDDTDYDVFIDMKGVVELYDYQIGNPLTIGACIPLEQLISFLEEAAGTVTGFTYCYSLVEHIKKVASTAVRNISSWAGNLMAKNQDNGFGSDIFTICTAAGATLSIASSSGPVESVTMEEFLVMDMRGKVIVSILLPSQGEHDVFKTYKIMPRYQFAPAYVNAGFYFKFRNAGNFVVQSKPNIVYGGISSTFVRASRTEAYLENKDLTQPTVLKEALALLGSEVNPNQKTTFYAPGGNVYKKNLAISLFYKFILSTVGSVAASARYRSGGVDMVRPVSTGSVSYQTDQSKWPLNQPMPKIASAQQASGEAVYVPDVKIDRQLYAAFVITTLGNARILTVDPSDALTMPGVKKYISAADIPSAGSNNVRVGGTPEQLFCDDQIVHAGQPVGIIVADSQREADLATKVVRITYTDVQRAITDVREAVAREDFFPPIPETVAGDPDGAIAGAPHRVTGEVLIGSQYHMAMETQSALCVPREDGYDLHACTQFPWISKLSATQVLGVKNNEVKIIVKRLGGGYGAKITRNLPTSGACAVAAYVMKRPVGMRQTIETNMESQGKRFPFLAKYEVGTDNDGKLLGLNITYYCDFGWADNDADIPKKVHIFSDNCYYCDNWRVAPVGVRTNTPTNTYTRAPTSTQAIFIIETIMDHIATSLGKDPVEVKYNNLMQKGQILPMTRQPLTYCNITDMVDRLRAMSGFDARVTEITAFNSANRWRKRGLGLTPMRFPIEWTPAYYFSVYVTIHAFEGSVNIQHAGTEIGQGINTKVIQVAAHELGIPVDLIKVEPTDSIVNNNSGVTGGSVGSELNCKAVLEACKLLNGRLNAAQIKSKKNLTWQEKVARAFVTGMDLSQRYWLYPRTEYEAQYMTYGVTLSDVEYDVLTGQSMIRRVDMLYDCGDSINPDIDVGQAQGAFVMGIGLFLQEEIRYDPLTGRNLTGNTWEYHVPGVGDIPVDFRVSLLPDAPNPNGVLGSKASGEPPLCMSSSVLLALKSCIMAARAELGNTDYFALDAPCTVENAHTACLPNLLNYTFGQ